MVSSTGTQVELRLPNRPEFVAVARLAVSAIAARMQFSIDEIEDIKVAVGEACTNAIEHGCPSCDATATITLICTLEERALVITVHDPGDGFDPATTHRQRHGTMTLSESGLGLLLIESLMDEVEFSCTPGDGTQVRMVKRMSTVEER